MTQRSFLICKCPEVAQFSNLSFVPSRLGRRVLAQIVISSLLAFSSGAQTGNIWNPARTFVLVASVTQWPAKAGLSSFTAERRRDGDLVNQLKIVGVPAA